MPTQLQPTHNGVYVSLNELLELRGSRSRISTNHHRSINSALPGESNTQIRGRGLEFMEVRAYQAGDDIRTIDWRVSARTGKPFTKLYAEEHEKTVFLAVDQRVNMFFGSGAVFKSVLAAKLAARIGWSAQAAGDRVGALVAGETINRTRFGSSQRAVLQILQSVTSTNNALSAYQRNTVSLEQVLRDCLSHTTTGTVITILSDFHDIDDRCLQSIISLANKRKLILIKVIDPLEAELPAVGNVGIGNGQDTACVKVNRKNQLLYIEQRRAQAQRLQDCVDQCSACLLLATTSESSASLFNRYVQTR